MRIFLSVFVDFVLATSSKKVTQVKASIREAARGQRPYNPHEDWRLVRSAIQEYMRNGSDGDELNRVVEGAYVDRRARYQAWVRGFRAVPGRRQFKWIEPPELSFTHGALTVTCKPDLGFLDKGTRTFVKLHFGGRSPSRERVEVIAQVMRSAMKPGSSDVRFGVIDLGRSSMRIPRARSEMAYAIEEQAEAFVRYWKDHRDSAGQDIA